ncbi:hypothetical protein [Micromonospora sediminicola]|uniref:hypothetical protein n=1 Tax=Micromonospora sediminicola TaxID=946078 RepID=UPI001FE10E81|nr:hypothetical protein [Micromonospora sediminicola]
MTPRTALPAALAVALLATAGCAGNGGSVPDETRPSSPTAPPTSAAPAAPTTPAADAPAASGAPADRPTPLSATELPTLRRPAGPPKKPTDNRPTGVVAGWITRGGSGPCYGLVDENGREYAVHGPEAGELREGDFVTLRLTSRDRSVDCGPGVPMRVVGP